MINRHIAVPGADLHHEIRGDGPLSAGNVVIGIGADSGHLVTYRTSVALADLFLGAPEQFADRPREVLAR